MKRVVVRVSDTYSMDSAAAAILKLYGYLTFVESFRSFSIITFDCPEKYSSGLLEKLNALGPVKKCTWDGEKFEVAPVDTGATLSVDNSSSLEINSNTDIESIILPKKTIYQLISLLDQKNISIKISNNKSKIKFEMENGVLISKVIDGRFPDYDKVIPKP